MEYKLILELFYCINCVNHISDLLKIDYLYLKLSV